MTAPASLPSVTPASVPARRSPRFAWPIGLAAAAAIAAFYVFGSSEFRLSEPDEARYAEIAREMLLLRDWVTPHLNFVKYFEKPPLVYWATAAAFTAFGQSDFTARLPSLLSGMATIGLTVWLAADMYGASTALLALPILGLGPLFGACAQILTLDMSLTFCLTLAMLALWLGWHRSPFAHAGPPLATGAGGESAERWRWWYRVAYLATALGILVKGPVAVVLVGAVALLFLAQYGGWRSLWAAVDWRGVALAMAVVLPWFVLVSVRNPEFLHFFIVDQHIGRYLWTAEHTEPIWFFLPLLPVALAPWGIMVLADPELLRPVLQPRAWGPATRFLALWAGVTVLFFSLSTSKLLTYILPAIPPLAVLTAHVIEVGVARGRTVSFWRIGWLLLILGLLISVAGAVLPFAMHEWRAAVIAPRLVIGGLVLAVTGWILTRAIPRQRPYAALATIAIGWFALFVVVMSGRSVVNDYSPLGLAARGAMGPDDRIAMYNHFTEGIPLYAQSRVIMVGRVGELDFGSRQGDQSAYFWKLDDLRREWHGPGRLFLVINRWELVTFDPPLDPTPIEVAYKDDKVLLVNRQ
jgi:4-amino-4-deoxy-L-arabinose transferase-like glycosyltransferase